MSERRGGWLRIHAWLVYLFLYAPIAILVLFSFNTTSQTAVWQGFTLEWYRNLFHDELILLSVRNSMIVGVVTTVIATVIGTLAALALGRYEFRGQGMTKNLLYLPIIIPEIVVGAALVTFFGVARLRLSLLTVVIAHVVFDMIFVAAIVRTRLGYFDVRIEEAARDLYATPLQTFLRVTLPVIAPGILAGAIVAFALSVDEFVIAFFTSGPTSITFPMRIYSMIRFGVTPEINAIATVVLVFSLIAILGALLLSRRRGDEQVPVGPVV